MQRATLIIAAVVACLGLAPRLASAEDKAVTISKLVAAGYEVKAVTDLTDDEQKQLWPKDSVSPFVMVTLEKQGGLAVCIVSMHDWIDGDVDAGTCRMRVGG